jgi:predicted nucleic acid-binding Zn ribbon protein
VGRKRPKLDHPEPIEELLDRAGESRFAPKKLAIPTRAWSQALGPRIADRTRPLSLENGVLTMRVATSAWATELAMLKPWLVERLQAAGFAVTDIRFRVGTIEAAPRPPERRTSRAVPPPAALPRELAERLKEIDDPELREAMALAARANLAWQTHTDPSRPRRRR